MNQKGLMFKRSIFILLILVTIIFLSLSQFSFADYDSFTVNIPNSEGSYTAIVVKKSGEGYVGPQGEYYSQFPTIAQLRVMYHVAEPSPKVAHVESYSQPQVQVAIPAQEVYQEPAQEPHVIVETAPEYYHPDDYAEHHYERHDDEDKLSIFDFKKKKKSQEPDREKPSPIKSLPLQPTKQAPTVPQQPAKKADPAPAQTPKKHDNQPPTK